MYNRLDAHRAREIPFYREGPDCSVLRRGPSFRIDEPNLWEKFVSIGEATLELYFLLTFSLFSIHRANVPKRARAIINSPSLSLSLCLSVSLSVSLGLSLSLSFLSVLLPSSEIRNSFKPFKQMLPVSLVERKKNEKSIKTVL